MKAIDTIISHMPPEMMLLLICSRPSGVDADEEVMKALSRSAIDWELFINLVDRHRVPAMVYSNLSKLENDAVPEKVIQRLHKRYVRNARRAIWLAAKLVALLRDFEREGISGLPLKGPVLALQVFGDLVLRHAGDLDLLVAPENVKRATKLLSRAGFRSETLDFQLSPRQCKTFMGIRCQSEHYHRGNGLKVDLHWSWFHNSYLFPLDVSYVWKRAQNIKIGRNSVPALKTEDTILYLCCHGAQHAWFRLFWLCDVAELLQNARAINWERLMATAVNLGIQRALSQGVILSNLLLGGPLPGPVQNYAEQERIVPDLVNASLKAILQPRIPWPPRSIHEHILRKHYDLKLRRDLRYKLVGCFGGMLTSPNDWRTIRLPDKLFPLYYLLRPFIRLWRLCNYYFCTNVRSSA